MKEARKMRLKRSDWLLLAAEIISKQGDAKLKINHLCERLDVTKGSFYAHFKNRNDFVEQFVDYWLKQFTRIVVTEIGVLADEPAEARLFELMRLINRKQLSKYDVAVRAWGSRDPIVARGVREADRIRFEFVREIFRDMGFRGPDLDLRTRLFVVFQSSYGAVQLPASGLDADEEIRLQHEFFIRA